MALNGPADLECLDEERRDAIRDHPALNGIDFVEYAEDRTVTPIRRWLVVTFLKNAPAGLVGHPERARVEGGVRITGLRATAIEAGDRPARVNVILSDRGDLSTYTLVLDSADLDPRLTSAPFGFAAGCPSEIDCRTQPECPPEPASEPALDYMAKDYASFRRLLLDLIPQRNPGWLERNPADLGMALVELLAYAGDHLSYAQDAVATEAYLDTARHRVSVKRHARLIDYRMHDGRNAWTFVHLEADAPGVVPQGAMFLTRVERPLRGQATPPGTVIAAGALDFDADQALRDAVVFEATARAAIDPLNNEVRVHTWGDADCCLLRGATGAYVYALEVTGETTRRAVRPPLRAGDRMLFEEVKSPRTGARADADPDHRQVVRLIAVEDATDPAYLDALTIDPVTGEPELTAVRDPADLAKPRLPLLRMTWRAEDALAFPLCLSTNRPDAGPVTHVTVARGNVVPCDHGRTVVDDLPLPAVSATRTGIMTTPLPRRGLTFQPMPAEPTYDARGRLREGRHDLRASPRAARPAIVLLADVPAVGTERWEAVPDLTDSRAFDRHVVADVDNDGAVTLRFGDGEYGRRPAGLAALRARYRIGNGRAGNVGRDALAHAVQPLPADMVDPLDPDAAPPAWPGIVAVRQPLAARGGADPETIEEVRQIAPRAFRAEQFRAVTEADYEAAALKVPAPGTDPPEAGAPRVPALAAAKCAFRWTGSWHTVFVGVHPLEAGDLVTDPRGRTRLRAALADAVRAQLRRYKLAGRDLEIVPAEYVPLEIDVDLCVAPGHFRGDVLRVARRTLSNRRFPDGTMGFFHPSRFAFGQPVYLSELYAAITRIEGVESAEVVTFKRYRLEQGDELDTGEIAMGAWEIARLDNDPNFRENGVLRVGARGGL